METNLGRFFPCPTRTSLPSLVSDLVSDLVAVYSRSSITLSGYRASSLLDFFPQTDRPRDRSAGMQQYQHIREIIDQKYTECALRAPATNVRL